MRFFESRCNFRSWAALLFALAGCSGQIVSTDNEGRPDGGQMVGDDGGESDSLADPDGNADTDSGQGPDAGEQPDEESNHADAGGENSDTGSDPCRNADCGEQGRCVAVDGFPTCACASGFYRVGLACLADPCAGEASTGKCHYVDSRTGHDDNPGSRERPWASLPRVQQQLSSLEPGDAVLFRRGGDWSDADLRIGGVKGAEQAPIIFGAYGPLEDPRPLLRKVAIGESEHVTLRDMEIAHNEGGPCVPVNAVHVIIQDNVVHDCVSNGIHFGAGASYGTMIDNLVYNVNANDALVIHNPMEPAEDNKVGDHHWIVDNRVPGPVAEQPVDVATGNDTIPGARDIKIVGNVVGNGHAGCIVTGHGTSVVWILGNIMGNCPTVETAGPLQVGGTHAENSGTHYQVRGNLIFFSLMSSSFSTEEPAAPLAVVEQNTIVTAIGKRTVFRSKITAGTLHFNRNILWTTGSQAHVGIDGDPHKTVGSMDDNWYVPDADPACRIHDQPLSAWQDSSGFDSNSHCEPVPGLSLPTAAEVGDFERWTDPEFLKRFVPDPDWAGCMKEVGAFDCQGKQRVTFKPFADYDDNNGYGWRGPLIVRQRYPLP